MRVLRSLLFPRFVAKIELGYIRARLWHSFPLDTPAPDGLRGASAAFSLLTTFAPEPKQTRRYLSPDVKQPSERDIQIYELHKAGKTACQLAEMFGISESRVCAIYWAMKKQMN